MSKTKKFSATLSNLIWNKEGLPTKLNLVVRAREACEASDLAVLEAESKYGASLVGYTVDVPV